MRENVSLEAGDALLIVDVQNDFLPGGRLAVSNGDEVIPVLNNYIKLFEKNDLLIFASRDWHPADHCSFSINGGIWPSHCVQDTPGAKFASTLQLTPQTIVISKADKKECDAYSAFQGTILRELLQEAEVNRLFVGGLATDYCVLSTTLDAMQAGYQVFVLTDAIRAVELSEGDGKRAILSMKEHGAKTLTITAMNS